MKNTEKVYFNGKLYKLHKQQKLIRKLDGTHQDKYIELLSEYLAHQICIQIIHKEQRVSQQKSGECIFLRELFIYLAMLRRLLFNRQTVEPNRPTSRLYSGFFQT